MAKVKGAITVNIERCKGCNLCSGVPNKHTLPATQRGERQGISLCLYGQSRQLHRLLLMRLGLPGRVHRGIPCKNRLIVNSLYF